MNHFRIKNRSFFSWSRSSRVVTSSAFILRPSRRNRSADADALDGTRSMLYSLSSLGACEHWPRVSTQRLTIWISPSLTIRVDEPLRAKSCASRPPSYQSLGTGVGSNRSSASVAGGAKGQANASVGHALGASIPATRIMLTTSAQTQVGADTRYQWQCIGRRLWCEENSCHPSGRSQARTPLWSRWTGCTPFALGLCNTRWGIRWKRLLGV